MQEYTTFNLQIPNDRVDLIMALKGFIKAFKIETKPSLNSNETDIQDEWKDFFDKYGGALCGGANAKEQYDEYRLDKYWK